MLLWGSALCAQEQQPTPPAKELEFSLRLAPMLNLFLGNIKDGPRGQTERLRFHEDLDLGPLSGGGFIAASLNFSDSFVIGAEYMTQAVFSPATRRQRNDFVLFEEQLFPQGQRTRSRLRFEWLRLETGLVYTGELYSVAILLGARYVATQLEVRGSTGRASARQTSFHLYFPGIDAQFKLFEGYYARVELRGSLLGLPFGSQVGDFRLGLIRRQGKTHFGLGAQAATLTIVRSKDRLRGRRVNNSREFQLYSFGLFLEAGLSF